MALCALVLVAVGAAGCGEEEGVAEGAVVNVYVEAPLCEEGSSDVPVPLPEDAVFGARVVCLDDPGNPGGDRLGQGVGGPRRIDLATVGANARRATQDASTIAYLQRDDHAVSRFTRPILDAAGVGWIAADDLGSALRQLTRALAEADSNELRADVREALGR